MASQRTEQVAQAMQGDTLWLLRPNVIAGQNSSVDPMALQEGEYPLLRNLRVNSRVPEVRNGSDKVATSVPVASATFRGAWSGTLNGSETVVAAYEVSGYTRIYTLNISTWAWTEITTEGATNATKLFGNSRLDTSGTSVNFCKVPYRWNPTGETRDVLLITNGTADYPRLYDPLAAAGFQMTIHRPISAITGTDKMTAVPGWADYLNIQSLTFTYTNSAHFTGTTTTATLGKYIKVEATTSNVAGETVVIHSPDTIDLRNCRQLIMRINDSNSASLITKCSLEISEDGTNWYEIYDPSETAKLPVVVVDPACSTAAYYGFSLDGMDSANLESVAYFRFTLKAAVSPCAFWICMIAGSGYVGGGSDWAVAYRNQYSKVESGRFVCTSLAGQTVDQYGSRWLDSSKTDTIPLSTLLYYTYTLKIANPNSGSTITGDILGWPTTFDIYKRNYGTSYYTYHRSTTAYVGSTTTGTWTGATGPTVTYTYGYLDVYTTGADDETLYAPDASHTCTPRATALVYAGARLFAGGVYSSDGSQSGEVWFSEDRYPFRFRPLTRYLSSTVSDPGSGSRVILQSPVKGFGLINGLQSTVGSQTVVVFTSNDAWYLTGVSSSTLGKPSSLGPHGCILPWTIARYEQGLYWLDQKCQVRRAGPDGFASPSKGYVDTLLKAGGSVSVGCFFGDRYYLGFTRDGGTQTRLLVWDEQPTDNRPGLWTEDQYPFAISYLLESNGKLLAFTSEGYVWQLEHTNTDDDGTDIEAVLQTREISRNNWQGFMIDRVGILCDACNSATVELTATFKPNNTTSIWSIPLDSDTAGVWRMNGQLPAVAGTPSGPSCTVEVSANLPSGTKIYAVIAKVQTRDGGIDTK